MDTDEFGDAVVEELKLHLVNRTETPYQFIYKLHYFGKPDFELKNMIHPFEDFYLHDVDFADLNDSPSFEFDFSLLSSRIRNKADHFEASVKLKPKQLFAKIEELKEKNQATFSQLLFEDLSRIKASDDKSRNWANSPTKGYKVYDASKARQHLEPHAVIDLHIEKLPDDWKQMSNYEICELAVKDI